MKDPFNLQRFIDAQDDVFEEVCAELRNGRKSSHWMWFIFPQIKGLGRSPTAEMFAISSREEAAAYASHPLLGVRLLTCTRLVNSIEGRSIRQIFGDPDDLKFRSCMTLFVHVCNENQPFLDAVEKYFAGEFDSRTLERLYPATPCR